MEYDKMIPLSLLVYALFANLLLPLLGRLMFAGEAVGMAGRVGYVCASRELQKRSTADVLRRAGYFFPAPFPARLLFFSATDSGIFLLGYRAWRTRFWRRLHGTPIRSVPFRSG
jgi:hypothetical protein